MDVFADLGAFLFARDFAHDRGYRICVDGVNLNSLPFVDRQRLQVDLIKINWTPAMAKGLLPNGAKFEQYLNRCGPARAILCRCDDQEAIDFGQSVGITLFQGRHVESVDRRRLQADQGPRRPAAPLIPPVLAAPARVDTEPVQSMSDVAIRVEALRKLFGTVAAVDGLSFTVERGTTVALLGANGAGKTTTISILLGLLLPTSGRIEMLGENMLTHRHRVLPRVNFSRPMSICRIA